MAIRGNIELQIKVATANLEPAAVNALLARTARQVLAEMLAKGEGSPNYVRAVNGRVGVPEEQVQAPGPIVYVFSYLEEIVVYALEFAKTRSPKRSGRYKASWFALVNGKVWDLRSPIPADAQVIVTNDQPYARKIDVGAMRMSLPPHIAEDTRQAVQARYGKTVKARMQFVDLAGAYRLRRNHNRKGRRKGDPITYPAVVLSTVG